MHAIIEDGGRQYRVTSGDTIYVDLRDMPEGQETIEFDKILAVGEGADTRFGQPHVEGAKVVARLDAEVLGRKIRGAKFRRRKNYRRRFGHRQAHLKVTVSEIIG